MQSAYPLPASLRQSSIKPSYGSSFSRKHATEEEYFDDGEEESKQTQLEYQPKSDSSSEESEEDPLDAFMSGIEKKAKKDLELMGKSSKKEEKGKRADLDEEDDQESYFRWLEENPNAGVIQADNDNEEQDIDYDEDGNIIVPEKSKIIDPLPPIDHTTIEYEAFEKNFYHEHEEIASMTNDQLKELRSALGISVSGYNPTKPVCSFAHFNFDEQLMKVIRKAGFTQPTSIQAQAIPTALSGRDIIGIAKTGSGKTASFLWPALIHIMDQKELAPGDGPIVLILAPTRELAQQIFTEAKKFGKAYNINCACAFGGGNLYEQTLACSEGVELLVCTPGRLIDLIKKKGTNLHRVTYMVFDEADRMFDMGFEPQVRSIANHVRPNRQTLLFSATFKKRIEKLAREILIDPIRIIQGELGEANANITQVIHVFPEGSEKWNWTVARLVEFISAGKLLIFVTQKANAAELAKNLKETQKFKIGLLHGDMDQDDRNKVISEFKKSDMPILIATDVAARGLDIPSIKTVVNYDVARDIDTHTHRIGRTGRAGEHGTAYTLVLKSEKEFCPHLVRNLEASNQQVPQSLLELAEQVPWFKSQRSKGSSGSGKKMNSGGKGLGYRERPGLGSGSGSSSSSSKSYSSSASYYEVGSKPSMNGPQTDRVANLKQAFASQFKSHFVSASAGSNLKASTATVPNSVSKKRDKSESEHGKKKSRWDD